MVHSCGVVGCKSHSAKNPEIKFYSIPSVLSLSCKFYKKHELDYMISLSKKRQEKWVRVLKRGPLSDSQLRNLRVCSDHFLKGCPAKLPNERSPDWAPCQNMGYTIGKELKTGSDLARYERAENRSCVSISTPEKADNPDKSISQYHGDDSVDSGLDMSFMKDASTQTDISMEDLEGILEEITELMKALDISDKEKSDVEKKFDHFMLTEEAFRNDDIKTKFFSGLATSKTLFLLHEAIDPHLANHCRSLSTFQQLILTLMKLRLNLSCSYLSYRFGICTTTVSRYFRRCVNVMYDLFHPFIHWPDRGTLHATMPECFKECFGESITVIVDCFEVFIERPQNFLSRAECWSNYKHHHTAKNLIGITPQGTVCFISDSYGGRASDKIITEKSGFLDHLVHGDVVMADRGFLIQDFVESVGATMKIPAFTRGKDQLHPMQLQETRSIANVRIHVERVIGAIRQKYQILSGTIPVTMLVSTSKEISLYDQIVHVCCFLMNLCPSMVKKE